MAPGVWPPDLADLKTEMSIADTRDDVRLQAVLDAAVAFVEAKRPDLNYDSDPLNDAPAPTGDLTLGTLRLAWRWHTRRRSPDGLVQTIDVGTSRMPAYDNDIERLLGLGKYRGAMFA